MGFQMDYAAILVVALIAAGTIVALDMLYLKPKRLTPAGGGTLPAPKFVSYARPLLAVVLIVLVARSFLFEPFRIPSRSMMPNLVDGDFIFVNKFSYGLRLPLLNTKMLSTGEPQRGDVVVFRLPSDPSVHYIKRLIGLPGDHIVVRDNRLTINGAPVRLAADGIYSGEYGFPGAPLGVERLDKRDHVVMFAPDRPSTDFEATVPEGHYFFMGDNRNDSEDGRYPKVGFVPEGNLVGRAARIWMNWEFPGWPHWDRIGKPIR
jgi:signal peptidase I